MNQFKLRRRYSVYLAAVVAVTVSVPAFGQIVNYNLTNTAADTWVTGNGGVSSGSSLTGTFSYNWTSHVITAANLTLSGGSLNTINYSTA